MVLSCGTLIWNPHHNTNYEPPPKQAPILQSRFQKVRAHTGALRKTIGQEDLEDAGVLGSRELTLALVVEASHGHSSL